MAISKRGGEGHILRTASPRLAERDVLQPGVVLVAHVLGDGYIKERRGGEGHILHTASPRLAERDVIQPGVCFVEDLTDDTSTEFVGPAYKNTYWAISEFPGSTLCRKTGGGSIGHTHTHTYTHTISRLRFGVTKWSASPLLAPGTAFVNNNQF